MLKSNNKTKIRMKFLKINQYIFKIKMVFENINDARVDNDELYSHTQFFIFIAIFFKKKLCFFF